MRHATLLAAFCGLLALAPSAHAQGCDASDPEQAGFTAVDIREINAIPQDKIDVLNAAVADGSITIPMIQDNLTNPLEGTVVEFDAVVLSDPLLSGLRTAVNGIPGGIHFYVRDMSAAGGDVAGRGIQVVDNRGGGEAHTLSVGSVITVCGRVAPFAGGGKAMQVGGDDGIYSITQTDILDPAAPANAALFAPVVVTTDDIHDTLPGGETILDFDTYSSYTGQYVRFEGISIVQGVQGTRPNVLLQSRTNDAQINTYDTSACFRNDRDEDYFPPGRAPDCIDDDFVPFATGTANVQGFLSFQGFDGGFGYSEPGSANFVINPFEEADFEVTEAPPSVAPGGPGGIPAPGEDATIAATITPAQGTITTATLNYRYLVGASVVAQGSVAMSQGTGDEWTATVPGYSGDGANGAFVAYTIDATDSTNLTTTSAETSYLVFGGAIDQISTIQRTFDGDFGPSPLITGDPATFDLDAVVQTVYQSGSNWSATIQDDPDLGPYSGLVIFFGSTDPGLSPGDQINITEATISEFRDVTQLGNVTFTTTSAGTPYAPKLVTTGLLRDGVAAEGHEGMLLRFEGGEITNTNPDEGSGDFGEWAFSSDGTAANQLRADDASNGFASDFNSTLTVGQQVVSIEGYLSYSFGNYKLIPIEPGDVVLGPVAIEDEPGLGAARIDRVFPNPSAGVARVRFALDVAGEASVRLFDVTGRQIATLAAGPMAAGPHTVDLDVRGLAAGVYVLRLEAEGGVDTARLSVVR